MGFDDIIAQMGDDKKDMKAQDNLNGQPFPIFKLFREEMELDASMIISARSISGDVGIYDNASFGIYGISKYGTVSSVQFVLGSVQAGILGSSILGSTVSAYVIQRVINQSNKHIERFIGTTFKDSSTTADWDTTNEQLDFTTGEIAVSEIIFANNETILSATIIPVIESGSANLTYELSADDGSNWESVTVSSLHTFTNVGTKLRWRITASGSATITKMEVIYNV